MAKASLKSVQHQHPSRGFVGACLVALHGSGVSVISQCVTRMRVLHGGKQIATVILKKNYAMHCLLRPCDLPAFNMINRCSLLCFVLHYVKYFEPLRPLPRPNFRAKQMLPPAEPGAFQNITSCPADEQNACAFRLPSVATGLGKRSCLFEPGCSQQASGEGRQGVEAGGSKMTAELQSCKFRSSPLTRSSTSASAFEVRTETHSTEPTTSQVDQPRPKSENRNKDGPNKVSYFPPLGGGVGDIPTPCPQTSILLMELKILIWFSCFIQMGQPASFARSLFYTFVRNQLLDRKHVEYFTSILKTASVPAFRLVHDAVQIRHTHTHTPLLQCCISSVWPFLALLAR